MMYSTYIHLVYYDTYKQQNEENKTHFFDILQQQCALRGDTGYRMHPILFVYNSCCSNIKLNVPDTHAQVPGITSAHTPEAASFAPSSVEDADIDIDIACCFAAADFAPTGPTAVAPPPRGARRPKVELLPLIALALVAATTRLPVLVTVAGQCCSRPASAVHTNI